MENQEVINGFVSRSLASVTAQQNQIIQKLNGHGFYLILMFVGFGLITHKHAAGLDKLTKEVEELKHSKGE